MFRLPSSADPPASQNFFCAPALPVIIPRSGAYTGKICKGGTTMETKLVSPHGDVDDLIYREEWTVSDR